MKFERDVGGKMYDDFFGRAVYDDGRENFASVDLRSGEITIYDGGLESYAFIAEDILNSIRDGRTPLINSVPKVLENERGFAIVPFSPDGRALLSGIVKLMKKEEVSFASKTKC